MRAREMGPKRRTTATRTCLSLTRMALTCFMDVFFTRVPRFPRHACSRLDQPRLILFHALDKMRVPLDYVQPEPQTLRRRCDMLSLFSDCKPLWRSTCVSVCLLALLAWNTYAQRASTALE